MSLKRKLIISALVLFTSPILMFYNETIWGIVLFISFLSTIYYTFVRIKLFALSLFNKFKKKEYFTKKEVWKKEISKAAMRYIDNIVDMEINWETYNRYTSKNTKPNEFYNSKFLPWNVWINYTYPKTTPRDNDASCFLYLSICPHCWFNFEKIVTRKRKCPSCKNDIYRNRFPNERCMWLVKKELYDEMQIEWDKVWLIERFRISNEELEKIQINYKDLDSIYKILEKILLLRIDFFKLNYEVVSWYYWQSYNYYSDLLLKFWLTQKLQILINKAEHKLQIKDYINFIDNILRSAYWILEKDYLKNLIFKKYNKVYIEISINYQNYSWIWFMIENLFNISQLPRSLGYNWEWTPDHLIIDFLNDFKEYCENWSSMELYSIVEYLVYSKFFNKEIKIKNKFIDIIRSHNLY